MMKSRPVKIILAILAFWAVFVAVEGVRLIGSADPGKYPILTIYTTQTADEIADYHSLGFAQTYHLTVGDTFVYGEFSVLGVRLFRWEV